MQIRSGILALVFTSLAAGNFAQAACPASKKEWQKRAPSLLIAIAARQNKLDIPDFSAKLGKGASAAVQPYRKKQKEEFVFVQAEDSQSSLFLSGVMKCSPDTGKPVLLSLSWVKGGKSGLVSGPLTE